MFSANDRIKFLEKELTLFREEAARTYEHMEKKLTENEDYRRKYEDTLSFCQTLEANNKELMKQNKILEMQRVSLEGKLEGMMSHLEKYQIHQGYESTKNISLRTSRLAKQETSKFNEASFKELFCECLKMAKK